MANNKWALTHVYQAYTANNNCSKKQMGINPCLLHLFKLGFAVINNKWVSTHVYSTHNQETRDIYTSLMHGKQASDQNWSTHFMKSMSSSERTTKY